MKSGQVHNNQEDSSQVTAVDRSPGTVSGCLVLGGCLAQHWGPELAAEKVLPVLTPLLTSPSLSAGHFAAALQCPSSSLPHHPLAFHDTFGFSRWRYSSTVCPARRGQGMSSCSGACAGQ